MWTVRYSRQAAKAIKAKKGTNKLSDEARGALDALHLDLEEDGPTQNTWPHYSKLKNQKKGLDKRHCHLVRGNPTYVACWEVINTKKKVMEVYYAGTHEKAPY
ncbi:MAG: cytotoxic translational repressor of toxin-antitoxin stability system [Rickettsiales bacterium]|nr:MAG: cytotoxic translational repressor of toxin-antitoxin stability system [Rickettsiales bacterium]